MAVGRGKPHFWGIGDCWKGQLSGGDLLSASPFLFADITHSMPRESTPGMLQGKSSMGGLHLKPS